MAAAKTPKNLAGDVPDVKQIRTGAPVVPPDLDALAAMVLQLQATVNEVISRLNAHTHSANDTVIIAGQKVQGGAGVAATNLFTTD